MAESQFSDDWRELHDEDREFLHDLYRATRKCHCLGGWHYVGCEEDGEEYYVAVPCKRCS